MERGYYTSIHHPGLKFPFKWKQQSSCTLPLKNKKNSYVAFKFQQSSDKEELEYDTEDSSTDHAKRFQQSSDKEELEYDTEDSSIDHAKRFQQSSDKEELEYDTEDSSIDHAKRFQQSSDKEELDYDTEDSSIDHAKRFQQSNNKEELDYDTEDSSIYHAKWFQQSSDKEELEYDTEDSSIDHAKRDSLHCAVTASSSKPVRTRSQNVRNGGSGLAPCFPNDRNRRSTIITRRNVNFVNKYSYSSTINLVGHTFIQNGGCRDCRQFQAVNVRGGSVTQGNVPVAGGGAAKYGR